MPGTIPRGLQHQKKQDFENVKILKILDEIFRKIEISKNFEIFEIFEIFGFSKNFENFGFFVIFGNFIIFKISKILFFLNLNFRKFRDFENFRISHNFRTFSFFHHTPGGAPSPCRAGSSIFCSSFVDSGFA